MSVIHTLLCLNFVEFYWEIKHENVIKRLLEGWEPADAGLCIKASYNKRGNQGGALVHVESIIRSAGNIGCDIPRLLTIAPVLPNL